MLSQLQKAQVVTRHKIGIKGHPDRSVDDTCVDFRVILGSQYQAIV